MKFLQKAFCIYAKLNKALLICFTTLLYVQYADAMDEKKHASIKEHVEKAFKALEHAHTVIKLSTNRRVAQSDVSIRAVALNFKIAAGNASVAASTCQAAALIDEAKKFSVISDMATTNSEDLTDIPLDKIITANNCAIEIKNAATEASKIARTMIVSTDTETKTARELQECFEGKIPLNIVVVTRSSKSIMLEFERKCIENILSILFTDKLIYTEDQLILAKGQDKNFLESKCSTLGGSIPEDAYLAELLNKYNIEEKYKTIRSSASATETTEKSDKWKFKLKRPKGLDEFFEDYKKVLFNLCSLKTNTKFYKSFSIVVFNEMFFGKNIAYRKDDYQKVEEEFILLSKNTSNVIYYVNILGIIETTEQTKKEYNTDANVLGGARMGTVLSSDSTAATKKLKENYEKFLKNGGVAFENATTTFLNGKKLSYYNKATYLDEDNGLLENKTPYVFGSGKDQLFKETKDDIDAKCLIKNVSTEICFDHGKIQNASESGKIHVLQSNVLTFNPLNINPKIKYVIHSDPTHSVSNSFHKISEKITLNDSQKQKIGCAAGTLVYNLGFSLGDSLFSFIVHDIQGEMSAN
jgi:hypothetical protein